MIADILKDTETRMQKAMEALHNNLESVRTGRASPALVERIHVDYYGTSTPLNQLAGISVPESRLIVIQPWDRGSIGPIEKAIINSGLGLNPVTVGQVIRVPLPPMTEERRRDLVKVVRAQAESGRVALRNVRREAISDLKDLRKEKMIAEDDERRAEEEIQKLTDRYVAQVDALLKDKEAEIMEF